MWRRALWIMAGALAVALVTVAVFLVRSRATGALNWPIHFELGMSDNGVLFQFARDVFTGRTLEWTFSPQVFVVPEIPISLVAYLVAGGSVQAYYVVVAAINNVLLFLALLAVVRVRRRTDDVRAALVRAWVASLPLVLLPLLGTLTVFEFALAPTYYFGMYLVIFIAPVPFFMRSRALAGVLGVLIALTVASNPLALVFVAAPASLLLVMRAYAAGLRRVVRPTIVIVAILAVAFLVRSTLFASLEGTSALTYIDYSRVPLRVAMMGDYLAAAYARTSSALVVTLGVLCMLGGLAIAAIAVARSSRARTPMTLERQLHVYYGLVPATGLLLTALLVVLNPLYLWPIIVAPIVFALLFVPAPALRTVAIAGSSLLAVALVATSVVAARSSAPDYLTYRSPETRCLDEKLPAGTSAGYAEYFEARRLELTSLRKWQLIQVDYLGRGNYFWLSNRAQSRDSTGTFFYVDSADHQVQMTVRSVEGQWGPPSGQFTCGPGKTVLLYDDAATIERMHAVYSGEESP